jgi:hypothetical protein
MIGSIGLEFGWAKQKQGFQGGQDKSFFYIHKT